VTVTTDWERVLRGLNRDQIFYVALLNIAILNGWTTQFNFTNVTRADSPRQLVVGHVISTVIESRTNWTKAHYNNSDVGVLLEYAFRVDCDVNYYGAGCSVYCLSRNDSHGHWTCAPDTGRRLCLPGWQGKFCVAGWYSLRQFDLLFTVN